MSEEDKELERIIKESLDQELAGENITVSEELIQRTLAKAEAEVKSGEKERTARKSVMPKIIQMTAGVAAACLIVILGVQVMQNGRKNSADSAQMESAESMDESVENKIFATDAPFESFSEKESASSDSADGTKDQMADTESDLETGSAAEDSEIANGQLQEGESQSITSSGEEAAKNESYHISGDTTEGKETIGKILLLLSEDQLTLASSDAEGMVEMDVYMAQSDTQAMEFRITSDEMLMVRAYENDEIKSEVTYELSDPEGFKEQIRKLLK